MKFLVICNILPRLIVCPVIPIRNVSSKHQKKVSQEVAQSLEHLSLVDFPNSEAVKCLEDAISFADKLLEVNTDSVEPLISTVHVRNENFRDDVITETSKRDELMKLASITEEKYYVAPPGNISLRQNSEDSKDKIRVK